MVFFLQNLLLFCDLHIVFSRKKHLMTGASLIFCFWALFQPLLSFNGTCSAHLCFTTMTFCSQWLTCLYEQFGFLNSWLLESGCFGKRRMCFFFDEKERKRGEERALLRSCLRLAALLRCGDVSPPGRLKVSSLGRFTQSSPAYIRQFNLSFCAEN